MEGRRRGRGRGKSEQVTSFCLFAPVKKQLFGDFQRAHEPDSITVPHCRAGPEGGEDGRRSCGFSLSHEAITDARRRMFLSMAHGGDQSRSGTDGNAGRCGAAGVVVVIRHRDGSHMRPHGRWRQGERGGLGDLATMRQCDRPCEYAATATATAIMRA